MKLLFETLLRPVPGNSVAKVRLNISLRLVQELLPRLRNSGELALSFPPELL
jgi:hypothetical protein